MHEPRLRAALRALSMRIVTLIALATTGAAVEPDLVLWDGQARHLGHGWPGAPTLTEIALADGGRALRFHGEGKDWIGCGWSWDADGGAGSVDVSHRSNCSLMLRASVRGELGSLTLRLASVGGGHTGEIDLKSYCPQLPDGAWHLVRIPLVDIGAASRNRAATETAFDPRHAVEVDLGSWSVASRGFEIDIGMLGFDDARVRPHALPVRLPEPRPDAAPAFELAPVEVTVATNRPGRAISPWIYGEAMGDLDSAREMGVSMRRAGGNAVSTHDWRHGFSNLGADWMFMNTGTACAPAQDWWMRFPLIDRAAGLETYLTVPMMGRVAKDGSSCGFPLALFPDQELSDHGCGNGRVPLRGAGGVRLSDAQGKPRWSDAPADPQRDSVAVDAAAQCGFLGVLAHDLGMGLAADGGVRYLALDNEPMLWHLTHRDMHPLGCSYDELWSRTAAYASALKAVDPGARICGPCSWGWNGYFFSGMDTQEIASGRGGWDAPPDFAAHGKVPLLRWYLRQLARWKAAHQGADLVDALDVHFYPQNGSYGERGPCSPQRQEARVQEVRALWDPGFDEPSWMARNPQCETPGVVQLLPMLKRWIAAEDAGVGLALGEYNFGGEQDVSGGIAEVELLGVFAREGLEAACYWSAPPLNSPPYFAFKLLRNPDGEHTAVGDDYLDSTSSVPDLVSVHATRDRDDRRLSLVCVCQRARVGARVHLRLDAPVPEQQAPRWRYDGADAGAIGALPPLPAAGRELTLVLPPMSATRIDLREAPAEPPAR